MSPDTNEPSENGQCKMNEDFRESKKISPWRGFFAVIVMAVFLLTAMQAAIPDSAMAATNRVLTIGYAEYVGSANPWVGIYDIDYLLYSYIYGYLMYPNEDGIQSPNLAKEWWYMDGLTASTLTSGGTDFSDTTDFPVYHNATDWPLGSIWEYNLTDSAYWNDGVPFTADDVEWSFEIQIGPNFMIYWAYQPVTRWIDHVEKVDDYKVRFFFSKYEDRKPIPVAWGNTLSVPVLPMHAFVGRPSTYIAQEWDGLPAIGTGPLMGTNGLAAEINAKESITLVKNKFYNFTDDDEIQKGLGAYYHRDMQIDTLIMKLFSEEQTQVSSLKTGSIDACELTAANYLAMQADSSLSANVSLISIISPTVYTKISHWNVKEISSGALNPARLDPAIHRASALATNKVGILSSVFKNLGQIGYHLITPVWPQFYWEPGDDEMSWFNVTDKDGNVVYSYNDTLRHVMDYNLARANEILDAAGYTLWDNSSSQANHGKHVRKIGQVAAERLYAMGYVNDVAAVVGKTLNFEDICMQENFEDISVSKILQSDFKEIGIDLYDNLVNEAVWNTEVYGYTFHFTETYWSGDVDPNYLLYVVTTYAINGWNEWGTENATYDYYYDMQAQTLDPVERMHWIMEACKWTYLWSGMMVTAYPSLCFALNDVRWTNWGNWTQHPGLAIDHFWGETPFFFKIKWVGSETVVGGPDYTGLIIAGVVIVAIIAGITAMMLLRKRKDKMLLDEEDKEEQTETDEEKG